MEEPTLDDILRLFEMARDGEREVKRDLQTAQDMAEHEAERTVKFDDK